MLTASRWPLREWLLFAIAALAPTIAISALALRALMSSDAAVRRESVATLEASAARISRTLEHELSESETSLARMALEGDADAIESRVRTFAPDIADSIVLDRRGDVVRPTEAAAVGAPAECGVIVEQLASSDASTRKDAASRVVAMCEEARTARGDYVWPLVALDRLRTSPDPALARRLAPWIEAHAQRLPDAERRAIAADLDRAQGVDALAQMKGMLSAPPLPAESLQSALGERAAARAIRATSDSDRVSAWRAARSRGAIRLLPNGLLAGYAVSASSLVRALPALVAPELGVRARLLEAGAASDGAIVRVTSGLAIAVEEADPGVVERRASSSRRTLVAAAIASCVVAIGFAWLLFTRMLAARRTSALRVDFAAAVSHELRTPIATVRMMAELLDEERVPDDERAEVQSTLAREARRLGEIVDRLLAFSRLASGRSRAPRIEVRVGDIVAASIAQLEARTPALAPVERDFDPDLTFPVDAAQLALAMDNLLANAEKHAPDGAPYRVHLRADDRTLTLSVADAGPGVARGDRTRIFQPFERVEDRLSRATEGAGIGLALVAHVARAHGGRAWVESNGGRGARFVLTFSRGRR